MIYGGHSRNNGQLYRCVCVSRAHPLRARKKKARHSSDNSVDYPSCDGKRLICTAFNWPSSLRGALDTLLFALRLYTRISTSTKCSPEEGEREIWIQLCKCPCRVRARACEYIIPRAQASLSLSLAVIISCHGRHRARALVYVNRSYIRRKKTHTYPQACVCVCVSVPLSLYSFWRLISRRMHISYFYLGRFILAPYSARGDDDARRVPRAIFELWKAAGASCIEVIVINGKGD